MAIRTIPYNIHTARKWLNNIGSGNAVLSSATPNSATGLVCRDGTLTVSGGSKLIITSARGIELGIPAADDIVITRNTTYRKSNIVNNLTVNSGVFDIASEANLTILGTVAVMDGASIVGDYSTKSEVVGDLEVLGEIELL